MRQRGSSTPSARPLRAAEMLRHALVTVLRRSQINDPALDKHNVTVSEVRMSPDLKHATIFVAPLGGAGMAEMMADLKRCSPRLRTAVAQEIKMRYAPELHFHEDTSFAYAATIEQRLHDPLIARDLEEKP